MNGTGTDHRVSMGRTWTLLYSVRVRVRVRVRVGVGNALGSSHDVLPSPMLDSAEGISNGLC